MATESANTTCFSPVLLGMSRFAINARILWPLFKKDYRCALMVARLFQFNEGWDKGARSPEPPNFRECHAEMETVLHIFQMRALAFATNAGSHSRCRRLDEMCEISGRIGFHGVVRSLWTECYVRRTAGFTVNYHPLPTYNWAKKKGLIYSSIVRSFVQNSRHRRSYFWCFW